MTEQRHDELCANVEQHMSEVLDGTAADHLYAHLENCDACRDARHDAGELVERVREAGADFVVPPDLEQHLLTSLEPSVPTVPSPAPQEIEAPKAEQPEPDRPIEGEEQKEDTKQPEQAETDSEQSKSEPESKKTDAKEAAATERRVLLLSRLPAWATRRRLALAGLGAAAAIALGLGMEKSDEPVVLAQTAWQGVVEQVSSASGEQGLRRCDPRGETCSSVSPGAAFGAGSWLETDELSRATLRMEDGSRLTLDKDSVLVLSANRPRQAALKQGAMVADIAHIDGDRARFDVSAGFVEVLGTKFALRTGQGFASVDVLRGAVRLVDEEGSEATVRAGEAGRIEPGGSPPYVSAALTLGEAFAWTETSFGEEARDVGSRGLGELRAKKPGSDRELDGAVALSSHKVNVRISGVMARTEVEEVFSNRTDEVLEGIYRFPMPPDAKIERLALEVDGKLEEGAFVDRERAAKIWRGAIVNDTPKQQRLQREEIIWVPGPWRDPALLEWQRGGRFELRIYPIPKQGSRRVVLAYTQALQPTGGVRRYSYPLAHDPGRSTKVSEFEVDIQVRGHDRSFGVRSAGYELARSEQGDAQGLKLSERNFSPSGDLLVEYALPDRDSELRAWAYRDEAADKQDVANYVAIALRPKLPRAAESGERAFAFIVDTSRSMYGESYKRARSLAARTVRELDPLDRVTVLACDTKCRRLVGGLRPAGIEASRAVEQFLSNIEPEGASDLGASISEAQHALADGGGSRGRIVYIGDGTPTVGAIRPALLTREVRRTVLRGKTSVTAIAIGGDSDLDTLGALAHAGGGVVVPYVPGQSTGEAAYALLSATYGVALRDIRVELPPGLTEVAPREVGTLIAGGEAFVVARAESDKISGTVTLRGELGGKPFEQRYPLEAAASTARGNAFVPRLFAALRIADLERETVAEARERAVKLSQRFNVASRHTSLLVLESPAMFRAFGLDNSRRAPEWTGEDDLEGVESEGVADEWEGKDGAGFGRLAGFGGGAAKVATAKKSAPRSMKPSAAADEAAPAPAPSAERRKSSSPCGCAPNDLQCNLSCSRQAEVKTERGPQPPPQPAAPPAGLNRFDIDGSPPFVDTRRQWVPMRRIWEREARIDTERLIPKTAGANQIGEAEFKLRDNENNRDALIRLYTLQALAGRLSDARELVERWVAKEPLSSEALTARADLAARSGRRDEAIRILGSVVDMRPDDVKAQMRLARLHRWAGDRDRACRFSLAMAQLRPSDAERGVEAVRCLRQNDGSGLVDAVLSAADENTRKKIETLLAGTSPDESKLNGDFRVEAEWQGGDHDLDLALITPEGHRVSWLGAPTRAVISARDVMSDEREGLGVRGAKPGEYVVEIVRASGSGPVRGKVTITLTGKQHRVPFLLEDDRTTVAIADVRMVSRLVPVR